MDKPKKFACLDLGSNTFHLLIVESINGRVNTLFRLRKWVHLSEHGIYHFNEDTLNRAEHAIGEMSQAIREYEVDEYSVFGTEALRVADNGAAFIQLIKNKYSIDIALISGDREAELIYKGVVSLLEERDSPTLMMDIGGGSTEFIIGTKTNILWKKSYQAGVTHLYNRFIQTDPIDENNKFQLQSFFDKTFEDLLVAIQQFKPDQLIGASGSFETLALYKYGSILEDELMMLKINHFHEAHQQLRSIGLEKRLLLSWVPESRAKLLPTAFLIIDYILLKSSISQIGVSPYALKEGAISELIQIS